MQNLMLLTHTIYILRSGTLGQGQLGTSPIMNINLFSQIIQTQGGEATFLLLAFIIRVTKDMRTNKLQE